ncbi:probable E3 ubiquitin-protein ligase TRIML2 isoform X1 [Mus caroli]|uniref:Probable E3 ubiquitin-protein ligase TRIML2 isoform X1 n=1 Tax=Mus caroli TaxID=10089 RepID=A0A6P5Q958_MUSCR|nr:probable E3 ubiquitin-protein ligase TRIML2 isoform X1 [Mus caroli]XP_021026552.1 probable E3 ubiquitin-protein ligase TRIML2 isoform X1 [Mus caroli]
MSQAPKPQLPGNTKDPYCGTHPESSQLFSDDDQVIVSSKCFQSPEHKQHGAYSIQEAAEYYRKLFQETLVTLREKLEAATSLLAEERERMVTIQEEEQRFKEMIEAEYKMRFQLLTEEEELAAYKVDLNLNGPNPDQLMKCGTELMQKSQEMLQRLRHLGRENMEKLKASEVRLSEHLRSLQMMITDLEKNCGESAVALLQNAKCYLKRSESILLQSLEPAQVTDLSSCQIIETSGVLLRLQRHITLDPDTAHPSLVLSEDLRSVGFGETPKTGPGTTRKLDFGASVLGAESFTTGRHYWEVAVGQATQWQVGICDCTERKGSIPGDSGDKVLLMGSMMGTDCTLWVFPPLRKVCLRNQMFKVGVFLDCECGQVSFYNVTEQSLIYSFSDLTFRGAVKPIFSLCIPNGDMSSDSLTVCLSQTHP